VRGVWVHKLVLRSIPISTSCSTVSAMVAIFGGMLGSGKVGEGELVAGRRLGVGGRDVSGGREASGSRDVSWATASQGLPPDLSALRHIQSRTVLRSFSSCGVPRRTFIAKLMLVFWLTRSSKAACHNCSSVPAFCIISRLRQIC